MEDSSNSLAVVPWSYAKVPPFFHDERYIPLLGKRVKIKQIPTGKEDHTLGTVCWDAAFVLCRYLEDNVSDTFFSGKTVLELGSGTGLLGIFASMYGAEEVIMTDYANQLPLIEENIKENLPEGAKARTEELIWGENLEDFLSKVILSHDSHIDIIICSDVVYNHYGLKELHQTLKFFSKMGGKGKNKPEIIMSYKSRYATEKKFFVWFERDFTVTEVSRSLLDEDFKYSGIKIFRAKLKDE